MDPLACKYILSICGWLFIKFNNTFVFLNPAPQLLILYTNDLEYMAI